MFKLIRDAGWGALGISVSAIVSGLVLMFAWHGWGWDWADLKPFLLAASIPWAMVFVGLLWLTWRRLWVGFESLIGYDFEVGGPSEVRIVPYKGPGTLLDGVVVPEDLEYFVKQITATGDWTQRRWRGVKMPSGRRCDNEYHASMVKILRKTGVIVDAGPRSTGRLTTRDAERVLSLLGLNGGDVN